THTSTASTGLFPGPATVTTMVPLLGLRTPKYRPPAAPSARMPINAAISPPRPLLWCMACTIAASGIESGAGDAAGAVIGGGGSGRGPGPVCERVVITVGARDAGIGAGAGSGTEGGGGGGA